ncbi:Phosphoribosylformylglycinamidine synthase subunit PurQ [Aliiroseovarius pelagivivens]|uniref:Phosphoribosylformylglycinamidine synthase subunit PurQ n=1 Tax=Aliiroseovarius pelagivivens TaxID=1639690 RepID=A0A2R8AK93_9RHOB|nr:phosphoribosylformylglycinamidine synthase subunit PurQ [Aliiroseovarius pelagivivens]SPF76463.1 Phosphoribosylformylglycinamidine synthase subunit PurQ [Aliiroseovarius pelagivivens]
MKAGVIVFPGSNCDRDLAVAFERAGAQVQMIWHKETELPTDLDIVGVPGGFSFGDYLRCGAIAAQSPITRSLIKHTERGGYAIGICNGFQVLTETGILPGALMRNANLKFICKPVGLKVETTDCDFLSGYEQGQEITVPVAHHDGNYNVTDEKLAQLRDEGRIAFTYSDNPNGSTGDIAGVISKNRRVLGMMPHPERCVDALHGGTDGVAMFRSLVDSVVAA